jgi:hypothetical protein
MAKRTRRKAPPQARPTEAEQRELGRALFQALLADFRKRYENGDKSALLDIVDAHLRTGRKVPLWTAQPFCDAWLDYVDGRVRTFDEALGLPPPLKNRSFEARKKYNRLRPRVVYQVVKLNTMENKPIDGELFAKVGRELGISGSTASRLYYDKAGKLLQKIFTKDTVS